MGRTHRPYYRICAIDRRSPRDGRVLEELGSYDPSITDTDARAILNTDRIDYWLGVGAQPSNKVAVLIKKYGTGGTHVDQQKAALDKLAQPRVVPEPGAPASKPKPAAEPAPAAAEAAAEEPAAETPAEETATTDEPTKDASAETSEPSEA